MQYNNTATGQGIVQDIDFLCGTNSTTFTIADKTRAINNYQSETQSIILNSMGEWDFGGEIATSSLSANVQEYPFPTDILTIKRIEVDYAADGEFSRVHPTDINTNRSIANSAGINSIYTTSAPRYDAHDESIFLFPVPDKNSANGIKIWYTENVTDFSAVSNWTNSAVVGNTAEPTFAKPFHRILSLGASLEFGKRNNMEDLIKFCNTELHMKDGLFDRLKKFYSTRVVDGIIRFRSRYFNENYK